MDRSFSPAARADANRRIASLKSEPAPLDRERFHVALLLDSHRAYRNSCRQADESIF
jgi:hypothetical protein